MIRSKLLPAAAAAVVVAVLCLGSMPARACVGKTLQVGVVARGEERLLTRMLSILINERTGTSIKIREFGAFREAFQAMARNEIDLLLAFAGQGSAEVLDQKRADSPAKAMENVRQTFNQRFNLVWLEPWGPSDDGRFLQGADGQPLPTQAAPLVRKDTLKEFPALARLINKMAGRLDNDRVSALLEKGGDPEKVARDYLKAEKLI